MRRLIIISFLSVLLLTCTEEYNNPVPSFRVYIEVDLTFRDKELQAVAAHKIFTSKNTVPGKEITGYAGVLVTYTMFGEYKAFDLACPNEVRREAIVEIDDDYNAVCKICGSKYEVIRTYGSGVCIEGPSKYALRPYRTELRNKILIIGN